MKRTTLFFFLALGALAATYGFSKIQSEGSELIACCDPATDPNCDDGDDDDGGDSGDSMPTQILG